MRTWWTGDWGDPMSKTPRGWIRDHFFNFLGVFFRTGNIFYPLKNLAGACPLTFEPVCMSRAG